MPKQRRAVRAGGWLSALLLLSAPAGCGFLGVRHDSAHTAPSPEQTALIQQLSERAQIAIDCGNYPQAILGLTQLVAQNPNSPESQQRLGAALLHQGQLDDAEKCFRIALIHDAEYVEALIGLGQVQVQRNETAAALKTFGTAIEIDPNRWRAHFCLGKLLEQLERTDDAMSEYFRALEFDPNNPEISLRIAANQLARNQPDQALSRLDQVLEQTNDNGDARDLRGRAHLALKHFPQAIEDFRAAAARLPNRPDVLYHLAVALEADHKPKDALRAAEQALRLAPNDPETLGLSQRLRR
jgi:tetratricopeptide (TPR) repeat protein